MAFEFSAGGHPTSKPYFQSSFARSLSFNTNQSQSLDFELSFRIAGKPADDDLIPILPPPTATDTPSPPASPTSATPPPLPTSPPPSVSDTYDEQPDTARGADSRGGDSAPTSPPPSPQPSSSSAHHHATGVLDAAGTLIHPVLMQTPKPKNGRMYLPSTTPKRRYTTLRSQEMAQSKSSVSAEIEVLRLRKECQSLIEDNRRLISAADRQARSDQTAIDHHHHHLSRQLHQHHNHHHNHHQHRHQTSQTVAAAARGGGGGGGCNTPKSNVETVVLQTQVDTLQWQLKQVESSRQMYHAVMEEVVRFLERCHQTLNAATDANRAPMSRSKSVNHVFVPNDTSSLLNEPIRARQRTSTHTADLRKYSQPSMMMMSSLDENLDMSVTGRASDLFANMKDLTWRRSPKHSVAASNTSPHADPSKLSQEAFRLLRTAQNLLNLKEPILAETKKSLAVSDDLDKTVRCATPLVPPSAATMQRKTNCRESRLSMQSSTDDSVHSSSSSRHETDEELLLGYVGVPSAPFHLQSSASTASSSSSSSSGMSHGQQQQQQLLHHHPHHHQPRVKSVASSADDESGFSSMSSFQDVGLPLHAAVTVSASQPPELPPRSRLSTASVISASNDNAAKSDTNLAGGRRSAVSSAVRMRPAPARPLSICHRRWSSTPAPPVPPKRSLSTFEGDGEPLKVLWV